MKNRFMTSHPVCVSRTRDLARVSTRCSLTFAAALALIGPAASAAEASHSAASGNGPADAPSAAGPVSARDAAEADQAAMDAEIASWPSVTEREVVDYWRAGGQTLWFGKVPALDARLRVRFLAVREAAARGELGGWQRTPEGALALLILLDQFPRNAFRGTSRMYATDDVALSVADAAIAAGHDLAVEPDLQFFFYLPFAHSERLSDQERAVRLVSRLGSPHVERARHHRDIVARFGRFPHRNAILGRPETAAERAYLANGGYRG